MSHPLYLDCEFNGNRGAFLSMGIYDPIGQNNFYEVSKFWMGILRFGSDYGGIQPWVLENVVPKFNKIAIDDLQLQTNLQAYLSQFVDPIIYADWPEDFSHLMSLLFYTPQGQVVPMKLISSLKMELITTPDIHVSAIPHNALEDAKALYLNHMEIKKDVIASN